MNIIVAWVEVDRSTSTHTLTDKYDVFLDELSTDRAKAKYDELRKDDNVYTACFGKIVGSTDYDDDESGNTLMAFRAGATIKTSLNEKEHT